MLKSLFLSGDNDGLSNYSFIQVEVTVRLAHPGVVVIIFQLKKLPGE